MLFSNLSNHLLDTVWLVSFVYYTDNIIVKIIGLSWSAHNDKFIAVIFGTIQILPVLMKSYIAFTYFGC